MASALYNSVKVEIARGNIDLQVDDIKVMLVTSTYVQDIDLHNFRDDITNEVVGTGYVLGGQSLAGLAVAQDNVNDRATVDATDNQWAGSTITARGAVLYKNVGTPGTDPLIGYLDFGGDIVSDNGNFDINWDAIGWMTLT